MLRLCFQGLVGLAGLAVLGGCSSDPAPRPSADFSHWTSQDETYRFYPGDRFRMDIRTAPELSADLIVAPDGRVVLPTVGPLMAAGRTVKELQAAAEDIYSNELLDPALVITPTAFGSQKIFVGGEVQQPGVFDLPGEIDPLQAILLAGGWTDRGKPTNVIVMRRAPGGELMSRAVDVRSALAKQSLSDIGPLKRFDVVYVTRKAIADQNLFVQQFIRDALPLEFTLFYGAAHIVD